MMLVKGPTMTWNVHELLPPQVSVALTVTRLVPIGKVEPLGGEPTRFSGALHPPKANAVKKTGVPLVVMAFVVMSPGQKTVTGGLAARAAVATPRSTRNKSEAKRE